MTEPEIETTGTGEAAKRIGQARQPPTTGLTAGAGSSRGGRLRALAAERDLDTGQVRC